MPAAARSDERGSRLRPFPGARPPRLGQWIGGARRPPTELVTAVKVTNDRMRGNLFSSCTISFPHHRHGRAPLRRVRTSPPDDLDDDCLLHLGSGLSDEGLGSSYWSIPLS